MTSRSRNKQEKLKRIFVIDGNWFLWRCAHTLKTNRPWTDALPYALLSLVCNDAAAVKADYIIVGFDGPKVFRKKIYPEYKANRTGKVDNGTSDAENATTDGTSMRDQVYECLPYIYKLFESIGLAYYAPKIYEADDVLCSIARAYAGDYQIVCGTQDKDAYQYLDEHGLIRLYDSAAKGKDGKRKPKYIGAAEAEKKKGVRVTQMVDYQTLIGDELDNIHTIRDMTPSRAKKILAEYGSIRNWYKKDKENRAYITSRMEHLRLNRKLVTLVEDALPSSKPEEWKLLKGKPNDRFLSRSFHELHSLQWPKSRGLF